MPILRELGLATDRPALAMRAADGVIVEVFEWRRARSAAAHENAGVLALWERFGAVCDYALLKDLAEAGDMFAQFTPIDL